MKPPAPGIEDILAEAVEIAFPADREAFLDRACGTDVALRERVGKLAADHVRAGSFLDHPPAALPPGQTADFDPAAGHLAEGATVGPYRVRELLGEGGMGAVYVADQEQPVKRRVALKVIRPGMDSREVLARFDQERQALALMDHPNIAKVLDGGTTAEGRPYFVMELVRGLPVTDYCDRARLPARDRLALFADVCRAVQHAHQKGVIHRDLKPSNVLVTMYDGKPVPKVIDFGVAKAVGPRLTDKSLYTRFAQLVGTPLYMSPEQAEMSAQDVDTRSDVYALGVLLYELLTGTTPFDREALLEAGFDEMRRIIREDEPPRPSARVSTLGAETQSTASGRRGVDGRRLVRLLRGDLDRVVMKALEKDRNRRYESVGALAADVGRYLADEPVEARPASGWYRLRKFARRNRAALVPAGLVTAALLAGAGVSVWQYREAAQQRAEADNRDREERERRARNADALAELTGQCEAALRASDADRAAAALAQIDRRLAEGGGEAATDRAERCRADLAVLRELDAIDIFWWTPVENKFPDLKSFVARLRSALAGYGVAAGDDPAGEAAERVRGSLVRDRLLAAMDLWLVADPSSEVRAALRAADPDPYRGTVRDAIAAGDRGRVAGLAGRPEALTLPSGYANALGKHPAVAAERKRAVLRAALRSRPGDLWLLMSLGNSYPIDRRDGADERVRWYQAAVAAHPGCVSAHNLLGLALHDRGDADGAIACYQEAIRLDPGHAPAYSNLGAVLCDLKRDFDGAIASHREAVRLDPDLVQFRDNLGVALHGQGDVDGAITCYREAIRLDPTYARAHDHLGVALRVKWDVDGAIASHREAIRLNPNGAVAHFHLGVALRGKRDFDGAIACFREAIRLDHEYALAHENLAFTLRAKGDADGAIGSYREAVRLDPKLATAHHNLGVALGDKGDADGAIASLRAAIRLDPKSATAHNDLGVVLCKIRWDFVGGAACFREAIRLDPKHTAAHFNLGNVLRAKGDADGAIGSYREAVRLDPELANAHYNLGVTLLKKRDVGGAIASLREAVRLDPKFTNAHNDLAWLLATGPDGVRDGRRAVGHATPACELTGWTNPDFIGTLAAAHAEAGDFDKAAEYQTKALDFPAYEKNHGAEARRRLDLYARRTPYRDPGLARREVTPPPRPAR